MQFRETYQDFEKFHGGADHIPARFNIYKKEPGKTIPMSHMRRDFFKITLITEGEGILTYADRKIHIKDSAIAFFNPQTPYSWQPVSPDVACYFCIFTDDFIYPDQNPDSPARSILFNQEVSPVFFPDAEKMKYLSFIFEQMLRETDNTYANKYDLLKSFIRILLHEAVKMQPVATGDPVMPAEVRIGKLFTELLERQFPIVSVHKPLQLKNANEFAAQLGIHINHLNKALKAVTGKSTTSLIANRIIIEAKTLLQCSTWSIAEISHVLGFEHTTNFRIFFKRLTGSTPRQFQLQQTPIS